MSGENMFKRIAAAKARTQTPTTKSRKAAEDAAQKKLSLPQLEAVLVEKLHERYGLRVRDIQRAFRKFDTDGSGHLSVTELTGAIQLFINGVDRSSIQELVNHYDVDGDGEIGIDEFTNFIISRNAWSKEEDITIDHLTKQKKAHDTIASNAPRNDFRTKTVKGSAKDVDTTSNEYKAKIFLQNMKLALLQQSNELRRQGKLTIEERLTSHSLPLAEAKARTILSKAFHPYMQGKGESMVDFIAFSRVLQRFVYPGSAPPRESVLRCAFELCCPTKSGNDGNEKIDPDALVDIIFDQGGEVTNKFGFTKEVTATIETGRPEYGKGPFVKTRTLDPMQISDVPFRFIMKKCKTALATPSNFDLKLLDRSLVAPSYEIKRDHVYGISLNMFSGPRVQSLSCSLSLDASGAGAQVGLSNNVDCIVYSAGSLGVIHNISSNTQTFFDGHDDDMTCLSLSYDGSMAASGQIGAKPEVLVWSTAHVQDPSQGYYEDEDDGYGNRAGGAQRSRDPVGLVARIGHGFFNKGVCAVDISYDNKYIVGVSCDDKHSIGVWEVSSGKRLVDSTSANGIYPQVHGAKFAPCLQATDFISKEHSGDRDMFCTVGERHLKFWSFQRPSSSGGAALAFRASIVGKIGVEAAKNYTCVGFCSPRQPGQPSARDAAKGSSSKKQSTASAAAPAVDPDPFGGPGLCDIVTGGSNGCIYQWREGTCIRAMQVTPGEGGSVDCLQVHRGYGSGPDLLFCGGSGGIIVLLNARTFEFLNMFAVTSGPTAGSVARTATAKPRSSSAARVGSARAGAAIRPGSAGAARSSSAARPASAGRPRPASAGATRAGTAGGGAGGEGAAGLPSKSAPKKSKGGAGADSAGEEPAWTGPGDVVSDALPEGVKGTSNVLGLALVYGAGGLGAASVGAGGTGAGVKYIIAVTGFGRTVRVDVRGGDRGSTGTRGRAGASGAASAGVRPGSAAAGAAGAGESLSNVSSIFHFHYGPVWALCGDKHLGGPPNSSISQGQGAGSGLFATGGDDKWLMVWGSKRREFKCKIKMQAPIRTCEMYSYDASNAFKNASDSATGGDGFIKRTVKNPRSEQKKAEAAAYMAEMEGQGKNVKAGNIASETCIAVGMAGGGFAVALMIGNKRLVNTRGSDALLRAAAGNMMVDYALSMLLYRRDSRHDVRDIKYSPNGKMLAVGTEFYIDIYQHKFIMAGLKGPSALEVLYLKRLRGHTGFVTHLDWSADNRLLKSTCASYELLFWDVSAGRQMLDSLDTCEADAVWHSETCALGFPVMGIWPPYSKGSDINSVDVSKDLDLVVTGDDYNKVRVCNFPCVAKTAPAEICPGHSSHVLCTRFFRSPAREGDGSGGSSAKDCGVLIGSVGGNDCTVMIWRVHRKSSRR